MIMVFCRPGFLSASVQGGRKEGKKEERKGKERKGGMGDRGRDERRPIKVET